MFLHRHFVQLDQLHVTHENTFIAKDNGISDVLHKHVYLRGLFDDLRIYSPHRQDTTTAALYQELYSNNVVLLKIITSPFFSKFKTHVFLAGNVMAVHVENHRVVFRLEHLPRPSHHMVSVFFLKCIFYVLGGM